MKDRAMMTPLWGRVTRKATDKIIFWERKRE
jgi:hypothetical protein